MFRAGDEHFSSGDEHFSAGDEHFSAGDEHFSAGDEHFSAGDEHFCAGDKRIEYARLNFRHTQLATSDYQTDLRSQRLLLTSTNL